MKTIETTIIVSADHTATLRLPQDVSPDEHHAVIIVEQNGEAVGPPKPLDLPRHDLGPWPARLSIRREDFYGDDGR